MSKSLIIVESPAKARTLKKYLGSRYQVLPSVGHVRDLPKSRLGVDVDNDFAPTYVTIKGKGDVIKELRAAVKKAAHVYLAPDPDREGEAIAWHLRELLKIPDAKRIELHEITKQAAQEALKHPSDINMDRVNAQQARRILDRLVGFKISPLLWRKIRGGLSAGRVQSVAVKLIVDREREIEDFLKNKKRSYWTVHARLWPHGHHDKEHTFIANLYSVDGRRSGLPEADAAIVGQKSSYVTTEADANQLVSRLKKSKFAVTSVKQEPRKDNPRGPFTTSTLQQEASKKLKMRVSKTMQIAQGLYEGVDVGEEGTVGLITYMRTDSTRLSSTALAMAEQYIRDRFPDEPDGKTYWGGKQYKVSDDAQDAHEAIRPTDVNRTPDRLKPFLEPAQLKLYRLIWERFVASQMSPAELEQTTIDIDADGCALRATGSVVTFLGYRKVYEESRDEDASEEDEDARRGLPPVEERQRLDPRHVGADAHETQPPPRYTEATLVKALEERGIGRPSTYASIVGTIQARGYVVLEQRRFKPVEDGYTVTDLLAEYFPEIVNDGFTSDMERRLDRVEDAHDDWVVPLREFWTPFVAQLDHAEQTIPKMEFEDVPTGEACPNCGKPLIFKNGRNGKFIACSGYPACKTTKNIVIDAGVVCPVDGGMIVEKRGRKRGKLFYGCNNWPKCNFVAWYPPVVGSKCRTCGAFLIRKSGRKGDKIVCSVDPLHEHGYHEAEPASGTADEHAA
ncbi:MAG TPA: type I DNA topoisomerase [Candidatus Eremiobacteraceae bacterium]|nr:type I DNA topoisomerase [Candidatus Eremiobacteraceae bacterium]